MKYRGIVYDVGLKFTDAGFSVEPFDPALVEYDLRSIANDLHANAVRIEGEEIHRLVTASRIAHEMGLTVFFNPWKMNVGAEEARSYYAKAAEAAEQLRNDGVDIVFVAGCEYPIFNKGLFPGETLMDRIGWLSAQFAGGGAATGQAPQALREKWPELNEILRLFAETVRGKFGGPVTYAATTFEDIDWSIFDIVGIDFYRRGEPEEQYLAGLQRYQLGKPSVVMELGCCSYDGAGALGDGGFMLLQGVNPDGTGIFQGGLVPTRNEREQADYLETQIELLAGAGVDAVFVYVFSFPSSPLGEGARDMDMMCFSLVKTFPADDLRSKAMPPWAPKESYKRVADAFGRLAQSEQ
jgi:hypothetical protein